ncbi:DNA/RNA non-specific endonuclease [Streptomyces sp. NBC_00236]|uniref:DNA/RNA non-specific endonuclease n=1 Tax=unclassified Streptomyces TaxID=2593676 RepID=UPI002E28F6D6|nr:DNA/RNA non-specific endonuclease [Streptomyces sp. NBC_00236]
MHGIRTGRASGRRVRSAALTGLTALTLVLTTAVTGQAAEQPPSPATTTSATKAAGTSSETSTLAVGSGEDCTATAPGSKERRAGAVESCVTVTPAPAKAEARTGFAATATGDVGSCDITNPGSYSYERFSYCVTGINVTYILRNANGVEIGRGTLAVSTGGDLSATATTWSEQVTVTMTSAAGDVTALDAKFRASCTAGCTATKTAPWYNSDLVVGKTLTGTVTYSSPQTTGSSASFLTSYAMYVTSPGATAVDPNASWKNARQIRCDDAVGGTSVAGCAVPSITPVVPMDTRTSGQGAAVAAYVWAQTNLDDHWGRDKLLTRATSGISDRANRTCGSFTAIDIIPDDTCAGFPFAETQEGGIDGSQCAEVIPSFSNGGWDFTALNGGSDLDPTTPCVRAHVPAGNKSFADTQLTSGFQAQRVIDADQFELKVTATSPGSCLNSPPSGSRQSGRGWIKNTTETVPHINRTDPSSPAGERASVAQACLGNPYELGSDATGGEITGWQDAQAFAALPGVPTAGLARCHLIANVFGGTGLVGDGGLTNLVPCWQVGMNTGTPSMRTHEAEVVNELDADDFGPNDSIFYEVTPVYESADSTIPIGVNMTGTLVRANGWSHPVFDDEFIPNTQGNSGSYNLGN